MTVERAGRLVIYIVASAVALDLIAQFSGAFDPVFPGIGLFTLLLAPFAIALLLGLAVAWLNKKRRLEATDYYPLQRRQHRRVHFWPFPSFGLIAVVALLPGLIFSWGPFGRRRSQGIDVYVLPQRFALSPALHEERCLVRVVFAGRQSHYYLNSRRVRIAELPALLKAEFKRRPYWVVYVDADRDVAWEDAVKVMDVVQGLNGKVVLLTPSAKAEASRQPR